MKYRNIVVFVLLILSVFVLFMLLRQKPLQKGLHAAQELPLQSESSSAVVNPRTQKNDFTTKEPVLVKSVHSEEPATSPSGSSGFNVNIGNESYSILFEGEDITQELKRAIITDLNLNFSNYTAFGFRKIHPRDLKRNQLYQMQVSYCLDRRGNEQRDFSADILRENFRGAVKVGDSYQFIINQKLIDAYEQAFQFKADHLVAFSNVDAFLELLKDENFINKVGSGTQGMAREIVLFEDNQSHNDSQELARFLDGVEIRNPSLLDFELATYKGRNVIRFITVIDYGKPVSEPLLKGYPQFIYMDGKWRIHWPQIL